MALIGYSPDMVLDYVPAYGGNRQNKNPCVISLHYVPYVKIVAYKALHKRQMYGVKYLGKSIISRQNVERRQFLDNVVSVKGVYEGSREIWDVAEFYDMAPQGLIAEIMDAMVCTLKIRAGLLTKTGPKKKEE